VTGRTPPPTSAGTQSGPATRTRTVTAPLPDERFFVITDLEDAIAQLPKVRGVRVVASDKEIEEIHVISAKDIQPKALVRDIISLLFVRFGVRVDRRCLSIVQSDEEPQPQVGRPVIAAVTQTHVGDDIQTRIELHSGRQVVLGANTVPAGEGDLRGGGLALVDAVENLIGRRRVIDLDEVKLVGMKDRELVIVLVTWHGARADESFVGSALSERSPAAAAARATLDAINRKLIRLPIITER
jgi:hypothetical protein